MRVEIRPEPDEAARAAIHELLAQRYNAGSHPAYASRWRRAALDYAATRPRKRRGATRA